MIAQAELRPALEGKQRLAELKASPAAARYLAADKAQKELLAGLRERISAGEDIETGPLRAVVTPSTRVSWEKFWALMREVEEIALALLTNAECKALVKQLRDKDSSAPFISTVTSLDVVAAP